MRVNLLLNNPGAVRSGYLNVDASLRVPPADPADVRVPGLLNDFPGVCTNEADEVIALDILDRLPPENVEEVFRYWASRLAHGGTLTVSALDYLEAAHLLLERGPDTGLANELLYTRQSAHTLEGLVALAEGCGLRVNRKFWDEGRVFVVATRP